MPWPGTVIVRARRPDEVSKGGIFIPEAARQRLSCGVVLGAGASLNPSVYPQTFLNGVVGHTVYWKSYAGTEVNVADDVVTVLQIPDVLFHLDYGGNIGETQMLPESEVTDESTGNEDGDDTTDAPNYDEDYDEDWGPEDFNRRTADADDHCPE